MKKWTLVLALAACAFSYANEITTASLKELLASKNGVVVLDARTPKYYTGEMIPGAVWMPFDVSEEKILAAAPNKEAEVVVYCASITCPASKYLGARLEKMGYTNVIEYAGGLKEWKEAGNSTAK